MGSFPGYYESRKLLVQNPKIFGGSILTTNFDPLIEISIRKSGGTYFGNYHLYISLPIWCNPLSSKGPRHERPLPATVQRRNRSPRVARGTALAAWPDL